MPREYQQLKGYPVNSHNKANWVEEIDQSIVVPICAENK